MSTNDYTDDYIVQDDQFFIQDDIDWEDPDVIADVFDQTDTKLDKFIEKTADIMFGDWIHYAAFVIGSCFMALLIWHVVRWIW